MEDTEPTAAKTEQGVSAIPFEFVTQLFRQLRELRTKSRGAGGNSRSSQYGSTKREVLQRSWLKIAEKLEHSRGLLANWKSDEDIVPARLLPPEEAFKIVSLIVPELDCLHSYIGMKEVKLADAFIKALDLPPRSENALWLKNFRNKQFRPDRWKLSTEIVDGSFPSVLKTVLSGRCPPKSSLTIGDVWSALDTLSEVSNVKYHRIQRPNYQAPKSSAGGFKMPKVDLQKRLEALRQMLKVGTPEDVSEICRILLKDTEINISQDWFLNWFHPGAKQHYNQTHDIHKLLQDCFDPKFTIGEVAVQVGRYASVMLTQRPSRKNLKSICERLRGIGDGKADAADVEMTPTSQFIATQESTRFFYMEPKLDGERMQLHMAREYDENGRATDFTVQTFSRRGMSSSDMYASAMREVISESVSADAIILDGEIMIWDVLHECWLAFSRFRDVATKIAQGYVEEGCSYMLKYMVFDVLYVDQSKRRKSASASPHKVVRFPLYLRRKLLEKVVQRAVVDLGPGIKSCVEIVPAKRGCLEENLLTALQSYCSEGFEGVIAKNPDRPYALAERSAEVGIKLKPDYFDGGLQDIDVIILGAKFSTSVTRSGRTGDLSTFLIGVRDDKFSKDLHDDMWMPVGGVGTGYTDEDLKRIRDELDGHWHDFDSKKIPPHFTQRKYSATLLRDVTKWIAPKNSLVLTIRAYELSMTHLALRFARVEQINWTKPYVDVITISELIEQDEQKTSAYVRADEHDADDLDARLGFFRTPAKRKKAFTDEAESDAIAKAKAEGVIITGGTSAKSLISGAQGANVANVDVVADAFNGVTFHVIGSDEDVDEVENAKEAIEVKIHELGGKFVQNLTQSVDYIVCMDGGNLRRVLEKFEDKFKEAAALPIVKPRWIHRCRAQKSKLDVEWCDVLFAPAELERKLLEYADKYGDPWVDDSNPKGVLESIDRICSVQGDPETKKTCTDKDALERINLALKDGGAPLRGRAFCVAKGLSYDTTAASLIVKALGGKIVRHFEEGVCVLVHEKCVEEWHKRKREQGEQLANCDVVTGEWVRQCLEQCQGA